MLVSRTPVVGCAGAGSWIAGDNRGGPRSLLARVLLTGLALLTLGVHSPAAAQLDLVSASATVIGAPNGFYFVDQAVLDLDVMIHVRVPTDSDRLPFDAQLDLVGSGDALCPTGGPYAPQCVFPLQTIAFAEGDIDTWINPTNVIKQVQVQLSVSGVDAFDTFIADQITAGRSITFIVEFDTTDVYPIDPGTVLLATPELVPLTGILRFANIQTHLQFMPAPTTCPIGPGWEISTAVTEWTPGTDPSWETETLVLGPPITCARPLPAGGALDLDFTFGSVVALEVKGQRGGLDIALLNAVLDPTGVQLPLVRVDLPDNTSFHIRTVSGLPAPRGSASLSLTNVVPPASGNLDELQHLQDFSASGDAYLRPEGVPLSFRVGALQLGDLGLTGDYLGIHYHYNLAYATDDPRRLRGPRSNDARFRIPSVIPGDSALRVTPAGLETRASFLSAPADTHFPRTLASFSEFSVDVAGSALVDAQALPLAPGDGYAFTQLPDCPGCPGNANPAARAFAVTAAKQQGIGADGAVIALTAGVGENPAWGPSDGTNRMYERLTDDTLPGVLFLPGFRAQSTAFDAFTVADYLLGMREATDTGPAFLPAVHHARPQTEAIDGNYFMAGLTMGPELLRNTLGLPEEGLGALLTGRSTRIGFGGPLAPDFENVVASAATKYVVREGGLTGVFNTLTPPQPIVYGHQLSLRRFAFRLVANAHDPETWIDGSITIPAPGDFTISMSSIELECSGDLAGGRIDRDLCDNGIDDNGNGVIDENCGLHLLAWQTSFGPRNAEFRPPEPTPPLCVASNRDLWVLGRIIPRALDHTLLLGARWSPTGMPFDASIHGRTNHWLDRPDAPANLLQDQAFQVALSSDMELGLTPDEQTGWFRMLATMGLPFWEDIKVDLRVQNRSEVEPAQTLAFRAGSRNWIANEQDLHNEDPTLIGEMRNNAQTWSHGRYQWGATRFVLDLPLFYVSGKHDQGLAPQLSGIPRPRYLSILKAEAGINWITPSATKLSFGASADFEALAQAALALHVDLNDPNSVKAIDDFLANFFFVNGTPVADLVGNVEEARRLLECFSGGGLDECIQNTLRDALIAGLGDADALVQQMQDARGAALAAVADARSELDDAIAQTNPASFANADQGMVAIYQLLPQIIKDQQANPGAYPAPVLLAWAAATNLAIGQLANVQNTLQTQQTQLAGTAAFIDQNIAQVTQQITSTLARIQSVRDDVSALGIQACNNANPMFENVENAIADLDQVLTGIRNAPAIPQIVIDLAGFDGSQVEQAQNSFLQYLDTVREDVSRASEKAQDLIDCSGPSPPTLDAVLNDVNAGFDGYVAAIQGLVPALQAFRDRLFVDTDLAGAPDGGYIGLIDSDLTAAQNAIPALQGEMSQLVSALNAAAGSGGAIPLYANMSAAQIQAHWDGLVLQATGGAYQWYYPITMRSVVDALVRNIQSTLQNVRSQVDQAAADELDPVLALIPVFWSGDELVEWILEQIMNRPVVGFVIAIAHVLLDEPLESVITLVNNALDRIGNLLRLALEALGSYQDTFFAITDGKPRFSILSTFQGLDGHAVIHGDDLERLHMTARFDFLHEFVPELLDATLAIDITRWSSIAETSGSCFPTVPRDQFLDVDVRLDAPVGDLARMFGFPIQIDRFFFKAIQHEGDSVGTAGGFEVLGDIPLVAVPVAPLPMVVHDVAATWGNTRLPRFCVLNPTQACSHDDDCPSGDTCGTELELDEGTCNRVPNTECDEDSDCTDTCSTTGTCANEDTACTQDTDCTTPNTCLFTCEKATGLACTQDADCAGDICRQPYAESEDFFGGRVAASLAGVGPAFETGLFVGRTCSRQGLELIDPQAAEFITFPDGIFNGIYVRGGTNFTIIPGSCAFRLKAGVDVGNWILLKDPAATAGGLIRGYATGKVMCLAGLRGQLTTALEFGGGQGVRFGGEGFGVAGIGIDCDPDTWTSIARSRDDSWCATADGRVLVILKNGLWERGSLNISGLH